MTTLLDADSREAHAQRNLPFGLHKEPVGKRRKGGGKAPQDRAQDNIKCDWTHETYTRQQTNHIQHVMQAGSREDRKQQTTT